MPTDSGAFRSQFCGREIVNAVLIVGGVASEKAAHTASHSARTPPERHAPGSARAANDREPRSPLRAYWSVYKLTHRAPGSRRAAGSRNTRTGMPPNLLAHYCYLWKPTAVRQAVETAWISASVRVGQLTVRCELDTGQYPKGALSSPTLRWPSSTSNVLSFTVNGTTPPRPTIYPADCALIL